VKRIEARSQACSLKRRWPDRQEETTAIRTPTVKTRSSCPSGNACDVPGKFQSLIVEKSDA
jgi:hypothetical protein